MQEEMKTPETILIFLLVSISYKILPDIPIHLFPFANDIETSLQYYFWSIAMRSILCYFIWALAQKSEGIEYYLAMSFFCLTLAKNIDFILCGNTPYFGIDWLTFNTVSITVFCGYEICRQWILLRSRSLY